MTPDLSRRLAGIVGRHPTTIQERLAVIDAAERAGTFEELPADIKATLRRIGRRPRTA